jgi:MYXO-CTERM domain-containing protein
MRFAPRSTAAFAIVTLCTTGALAQQETIQYDSVVVDTQAAITCGFCAGEKYGVIFYALGPTDGLQPTQFPFMLDTLQLPIAPTQVTGDILSGFVCEPRAESGMVGIDLEIYTGRTIPGTIDNQSTGAWPDETLIFGPVSASLEYSAENPVGSGSWEVRLNTIQIGTMVSAPDTYVRVVVNIGNGGSSEACSLLSLSPPNISPFRDNDGRVGPRRNFIREAANSLLGTPEKWTWTEDVMDLTTGATINGDWMIRLQITPQTVVPPDDAGIDDSAIADAGADSGAGDSGDGGGGDTGAGDTGTLQDSGAADIGGGGGAPTITSISPSSAFATDTTGVTVVGTGFVQGLTMRVGTTFAAVKQVAGGTTINADIPPIAPGTYDVVVTNPDGQSAILAMGFKSNPKDSVNPPPVEESGCGCSTTSAHRSASWLALVALGLFFVRRR